MVTTVPTTLFRFLTPFADHLAANGWSVEAATGDGPETATVSAHFDRVWPLAWSRRVKDIGNLTACVQMRKLLAAGHFDIVHVHTPIASVITRLSVASLGRQRRPMVVYTAHGFHSHPRGSRLKNTAFETIERVMGLWTDRLIVINDHDEALALKKHIVPVNRLVHMPGIGIDLAQFSPAPELLAESARVREGLGLPNDAVVYVVAAELQPGKNHAVLLHAMARMPDRRSQLILAGEGPERATLQNLTSRLGLQDRVHFLGFVRTIRQLILAADATVMPSRREGLSRAVLESLALGVPVVGADTRGVRDLIDSDTGVIVDPDDPVDVARGLMAVRDIAGRGALRPVVEDRLAPYAIENIIALHDNLYRQCTRHDSGTLHRASPPADLEDAP
jgi:glycosyltransferase involved in cell wall biosynthesis